MSVKIRMSRGGTKQKPYYRIVAIHSRDPRDSRYIERLGTYDPRLKDGDPKRVVLNEERIKYWLSVGAQPSDRIARFLVAQEIDQRIDVLTHAIDRRFAVLKIEVGGPRIPQKESEKWGAAPQGTRLDLLLDIKHILQKAIDDIDTLYERPNSAILPDPTEKKDAKGFKDLFPTLV